MAGLGSDPDTVSRELAFTGREAHFVVPAGVCRVQVEAAGASGGPEGAAGTPGLGARASATVGVRPAETLLLYVGGQGEAAVGTTPGRGGWNGGADGGAASDSADGRPGRAGSGGGGATDVRRGAGRLDDRILVAGGGAGGGGGIAGSDGLTGGDGGSPEGSDGFAPLGVANPTTGGHGGAQLAGGTAGADGPDGALTAHGGSRGAGGSGASGGVNGGGGGGGGFYGGGGGGTEFRWTARSLGAGQGGGGSSFGPPGTSFRSGVWGNLGDGWIKITYDSAADACADRRAAT